MVSAVIMLEKLLPKDLFVQVVSVDGEPRIDIYERIGDIYDTIQRIKKVHSFPVDLKEACDLLGKKYGLYMPDELLVELPIGWLIEKMKDYETRRG